MKETPTWVVNLSAGYPTDVPKNKAAVVDSACAAGAGPRAERADSHRSNLPGYCIEARQAALSSTRPAGGRGRTRLHLQVTDQDRSGPTVVLEAGLGFPSVEWAWVRQEVAHFARVVAYDRAGVAWSESGPKPRDGQRIAEELYAALNAAGIEGPYVLVACWLRTR